MLHTRQRGRRKGARTTVTKTSHTHHHPQHRSKHQEPQPVIITGEALTRTQVIAVARRFAQVSLDATSIERIQAARAVIDRLASEGKKVYGVTTGFGHLSSVRIAQEQLEDLQHNLLRSHAAGVGEMLSEEVARAMMCLLAASPR